MNPVSKQRKNHDVPRNTSAMLNFAPHPLALLSRGAGSFAAEWLNLNTTVISSQLSAAAKGRLQGTDLSVPCAMVSLAVSGRDTVIYVFVQCECASKKAPLKKCSG